MMVTEQNGTASVPKQPLHSLLWLPALSPPCSCNEGSGNLQGKSHGGV